MQTFLQRKSNDYDTTYVCIYSFRYPACIVLAPYCNMCSAPLCSISPHYLINGKIIENKVIEYKMCVFEFLYKFHLIYFFLF